MAAQITTLIDKTDNFEIVRDKIALILAEELANQQVLAVAADPAQDPILYKANIYTERSRAMEQFLEEPTPEDAIPIINVWFDTTTYDRGGSNTFERQQSISVFNIDIYGYGQAEETNDGHSSGDENAAREAQRMCRLVRNILMASPYIKLDMLSIVGDRWPLSITQFQPQFDGQTIGRVVGVRLALEVKFNEFSPQYEPVNIEELNVQVIRGDDGKILVEAEYNYTS